MPEGAEVRVVADAIEKRLPCLFEGAEIIENNPGILHRYSRKPPKNWNVISHNRFVMYRARTRGKLILLDIQTQHDQKDWVIAITLGMEADFRWDSAGHKHTRFSFIKERGDLSFVDSRCFGTIRILTPKDAEELENSKGWDLLEAPMPDSEWLQCKKHRKLANKQVGPVLLDQSLFAGIGNIYKAECLFLSKVHPQSIVKNIPDDKWLEINQYAHKVLQDAYHANGTSVIDFTADGIEGQGQNLLRVYMKEYCPEKHQILKVKQGKGSNERTSWFCTICQIKY